MRLVYHVMSTPAPLGLLFLAAGPAGLRHLEFMDRRSLKRTIAAHEPREAGATWEPSLRDLRPLADQLDEYLSGARRKLEWPIDPQGDPLSLRVWEALLQVPYGGTCTVATLARAIGEPRNLRAVAHAVLTNPIAILVPCHRVLGADGKPSNYVGGPLRKKFLLGVEQRFSRMGGLDDNRVIGSLLKRAPRPVEAAMAERETPARAARSLTATGRGDSAATATQVKTARATAMRAVTPTPAEKTPALRAGTSVKARKRSR